MAQTLHIAILNADAPVPTVSPIYSSYGLMFSTLLSAAATRLSPSLTITTTEYDVFNTQHYPSPSDLHNTDLILITGSGKSAYDDLPWIHALTSFIQSTYLSHPDVKWFGSCFGHQIICHALLQPYKACVMPSPAGFEIGVVPTSIDPLFADRFEASTGSAVPSTLRLQYVHGDFVHIPDNHSLPENWVRVGSTPVCANQGMLQPGRVFTLQGHFEFDRFVNGEIVKAFFADRGQEWMEERLRDVEQDDDAEAIAEMVLRFVVGKRREAEGYVRVGGLATPPEELA